MYTVIDPMEFAKRLQWLRERQRPVRSRKVVSELCGIHSDAYRRYERGEVMPSMHALVALADYYEVSVDYLIGRSDRP
jgi:transcriptional regulator with XRE-family HTH domain